MITFGKHTGKTYMDMILNEKNYCKFVLNQKNCTGKFKEFKNFIEKNINILNKINTDELKKKVICCSKLSSDYMQYDFNVLKIINNININDINIDKINNNEELPPSLFGQFVDYLIRYEISKLINIKFSDMRTLAVIYSGNDDDTDNDTDNDNDIFDDNVNVSKIGKNKLITINNKEKFKNINKLIKKDNKIISLIINDIQEYSYYKMQNNMNVLLIDILNVSICHSLFFSRHNDINFLNYKKEIISNESHQIIKNYIKSKINNKKNILLNPVLGGYYNISADADIIIDNEIIDIKCSKYIGVNITDFIQLIIYATLYYLKTNNICEKLIIYNPILGKEFYIIINENIIKQFNNILLNYGIGGKCMDNGNLFNI